MSAGEDYLDQRIRRVELRELELERRERQLAVEIETLAPSVTAGELIRRAALRILELEHELADAVEQREAARTLAARLEAETAACPTWIFHQLDELDDPARDEART